ncbi:hypothetical protein D3C72_1717970 [compost metagenome]
MPLGIRHTGLGQDVEGDLAVEETRLQRPGIEQFGGLPRQLGHPFAAPAGDGQAGHHTEALWREQVLQRRQHARQGHGGGAGAGQLVGSGQAFQQLRVGFRHQARRFGWVQGAGKVDQRAARGLCPTREAAGHGLAGSEEDQADLGKIEVGHIAHAQVASLERQRGAGGLATGKEMKGADREFPLLEELDEGFANGAGGADHGDVEGLAHGGLLLAMRGAAL